MSAFVSAHPRAAASPNSWRRSCFLEATKTTAAMTATLMKLRRKEAVMPMPRLSSGRHQKLRPTFVGLRGGNGGSYLPNIFAMIGSNWARKMALTTQMMMLNFASDTSALVA